MTPTGSGFAFRRTPAPCRGDEGGARRAGPYPPPLPDSHRPARTRDVGRSNLPPPMVRRMLLDRPAADEGTFEPFARAAWNTSGDVFPSDQGPSAAASQSRTSPSAMPTVDRDQAESANSSRGERAGCDVNPNAALRTR